MAKKSKEKVKRKSSAVRGSLDYPFLILVIALMGIGLLMLFSASYAAAYYDPKINNATYYFTRQAIFAVAGVSIMFIISFMDYRRFRVLSPLLMIGSIALLILVLIIGKGNFGEKRWSSAVCGSSRRNCGIDVS